MEANMAAIGGQLKRLRQERGWSLDRLARESGVSKAMLGQIERHESTPTIATLWRIASGLHAPISSFLQPVSDSLPQRGAAPAWHFDASGMIVMSIFPFDPALGFEMLLIEMPPGTFSESSPHAAGVVEHVVILEGSMELCIGGEWQVLKAGDRVRFAADRPHGYRNHGERTAKLHDMIHYPRLPTSPVPSTV
ncbi:helix-turn-helix domain-containing protein [Salinicola avicenniae]|uniref:helix-turn-helix domain-containing protein n=1 Tax=Salinicola avicenniae TaxID=2916836 RepID=UPI002073B87A|nr:MULTISPECIES: XRE family transcriptional regulator [unclassified Salinicola]